MTTQTRKHGAGRRKTTARAMRERRLATLAGRQYGVVGRWQLVELGFGAEAIKAALSSGRLHPLHREAYAVGHRIVVKRGKWLAAVLAMGPGAFLSHESAAALWGLAGDRPKVHVNAPRGRQVRPGRRSGIKVHRCKFAEDEVTVHDGIPVSTVARTLFDLAERSAPHELKSAWDEADRLKRLRIPEIARGRRRARAALKPILLAEQRYVEDTASPLEDRFAAFVVAHRLPPPQTNVLVDDDEVDVLWPEARLIVELDSWEFHAHRAAFEKDRDRDADHLLAGYRTIRVTHRRLRNEPERLAAQIRALLNESRS
jgi:very-short-patch-repair endonuclease/predicted transcriptional regulator of viral defense system